LIKCVIEEHHNPLSILMLVLIAAFD